MNIKSFSLIVPSLNAGSLFNCFLDALGMQTLQPERAILIDSGSVDSTVMLARETGFEIKIIRSDEFNHGGTRQMGADLCNDTEIIVFLTQDAILADPHALENLVYCLADDSVGAVYGQQLPSGDATKIASHARMFNYSLQSHKRSKEDLPLYGIKAAFISNSFAAYRRTALDAVGGFPKNAIFGEDTCVAARMLLTGWKIHYCAEAQVYHSHNYSICDEFRRYFDIGVFHSRERWFLKSLGKPEDEGIKFVVSEMKFLLKTAPVLIPSALIRTFFKYLGYKLGNMEGKLPLKIKARMSMNTCYWNAEFSENQLNKIEI